MKTVIPYSSKLPKVPYRPEDGPLYYVRHAPRLSVQEDDLDWMPARDVVDDSDDVKIRYVDNRFVDPFPYARFVGSLICFLALSMASNLKMPLAREESELEQLVVAGRQ